MIATYTHIPKTEGIKVIFKEAVIDETGRYRYYLYRKWSTDLTPTCVFIMLNPSTANAEKDDPTIRRCMRFAYAWGYGGIEIINIFGYRATDPKHLWLTPDPEGPDNQKWVRFALGNAAMVIAAWGDNALNAHSNAYSRMLDTLAGLRVHCLGLTKKGQPRHPLFAPANTTPRPLPDLRP